MAYQGTIAPILAGQGGYNASDNFDAVPYTDLLEANNIRYDGMAWRKAGGLALYDNSAVTGTPNCVAGLDFWVDASTQFQITAWDNGKVYKETSGNIDSVELANSLAFTNSPPVLLACGQETSGNNRKVLLFSQGQPPLSLNASANTMAALTNVPADWSSTNQPMAAIMHDRRVYAFGNPAAKHALYVSAIDDHTNFLRFDLADSTSDLLPSFDVNSGEGEEIRALWSLGTTRLYVFKYPYGVYFVDTSSVTSYFAPINTVRTDLGIGGPKCITRVGSVGTFFIGSDGHIYSLDLVSNPDVDPRDASLTGQKQFDSWIKDNVDLTKIKFAQLIWDSNRKELWAVYRSQTANGVNDLALVIDFRDPQNPKIAVENRGAYFGAMWLHRNTSAYTELMTSGTGGLVYKANQSTRVIGASTGYDSRLRTADTDFSWMNQNYASYTKRFDWLEIVYNSTTNANCYIDTFIDGQYYNTYTALMGRSGAVLGSFILGTDTLATFGQARAKTKIGGIGKRFGVRLRNNSANSDFSISRLLISFVPQETGGEKGI